ncbi:hypothetical protein F8R89_18785 [Streptomyces sp. SS1-1]|nr:hypothetical protein F8R89_18785 [Streptomyces sp. SS1-1]
MAGRHDRPDACPHRRPRRGAALGLPGPRRVRRSARRTRPSVRRAPRRGHRRGHRRPLHLAGP